MTLRFLGFFCSRIILIWYNFDMNVKEKIFINECKIDDWMEESEKKLRLGANEVLKQIIDNSKSFNEFFYEIEYFHEGVASVVAKVLSEKKEFVIKVTNLPEKNVAEALSFREWRKIGINVPVIHEEGVIEGHYFFVMDYFNEGTLLDKVNNGEKDLDWVSDYIGKVFAKMQNAEGVGFGLPFYDKDKKVVGTSLKIDDYLESEFLKNEFSVTDKHSNGVILSDVAKEKIGLLKLKVSEGDSELSSFDFGPRHFFATEIPTLFDPDPMLVPKGFGVANLMMPTINKLKDNLNLSSGVVGSYIKNGGFFDIKIIRLSLWLQTYRKASSLLLLPDEKRTERAIFMIDYLLDEPKMDDYVNRFINI
jgi:hypothetical protein